MGTWHPLASCIVLSFALALAAAQLNPCPAPETLRPCMCDHTGINCMKAKSTAEIAKAFHGKEKTVHRALWMQKLPIDKIANDTFGDFAFGKVYVEISSNLTSFPLSSLEKSSRYLTELSLYGNAFKTLTSIDYRWLPRFQKLRTLNLAKNRLSHLPVGAFSNPSLETLSLNDNPIATIGAFAFKNLPSLRNLQLRMTQIKTLVAYSLAIPKHHWELQISLAVSKLEDIEENAFEGTAPLTLDLAFNNLKEFTAPVFQPLVAAMAKNARDHGALGDARISTKGNSFNCAGCEYSWLTTLRNKPDVMLMLIDFRCHDYTPVWNLTNAILGCPISVPRP